MWWKSILAAGSAFLLGSLVALYAAGPPLESGAVRPLSLQATPAPLNASDPAADRIGRLRYLGGLVLGSQDRRFGGISAMLWFEGCDRLLAVSDTGAWVILEPVEADRQHPGPHQSDRQLTGIRAAWTAPLLGIDGKPAASKSAADAESLARAPNGDIWVFHEQRHRGLRYVGVDACQPESLAIPPVEQWEPEGADGWPPNGGIESAAFVGGTILLLSEGASGPGASRMGLAGAPSVPMRAFSYAAPDGTSPTAMEPRDPGSDNGMMIVLQRSASPFRGFSAVLSEAQIGAQIGTMPDAVIKPREIARLQAPMLVDNMEALAIRMEGERRYLYMMSDNNFNPLQRTLLMKFELLPEKPARDGSR